MIYMDMYVHVYVVSLYYNSSTFNCLRIKNNYLVLSIPYPQEVHVSISDKDHHVPRGYLSHVLKWKAISGR